MWTHPATAGKFNLATAIEVMRRAAAGYEHNKDDDWTPDFQDVRWQQQHVAKMEDGTVWETSEGRLVIIPSKKLYFVAGGAGETNIERICAVFSVMGWEPIQARRDHVPQT